MAIVDERRERCDGCGRTVALEELTAVSMPNGERVACCPGCAPHARRAARKTGSLDRSRGVCDGCGGSVLRRELEDLVVADGAVVTCCPSCREAAPGADGGAGADDAASATGSRDGSETDRERLCSQCHEWTREERFRVRTIDGRTEKLCGDCKEIADRNGVIADVGMRTPEAREVLDVGPDASADEIRRAYHRAVKSAHPDREGGSRGAFALVTEAYERLTER